METTKTWLALGLCLSLYGCGDNHDHKETPTNNQSTEPMADANPSDDMEALPTCSYSSPFSGAVECIEYSGTDWTVAKSEEDCAARTGATFQVGRCDSTAALGACVVNANLASETQTFIMGDDAEQCALTAAGCQQFAAGSFRPNEICADVETPMPEPVDGPPVSSVFIPPMLICSPSVDDTPGSSDNGDVCTWQSIGGCTEPGRKYADYAECDTVLSQRPFFPIPPSGFETPEDDPIRSDDAFLAEVEWAKGQAESCGCVCCHTTGTAPRGAAAFDTAADGIWTDTFTKRGLAIAAGWIDSSPLGAHAAMDNNGFDRSRTGLPTTDVERMIRFFEGELARRGATRDEFEGEAAIGGPLATQATFEPEACASGIGIDVTNKITWSGGAARYLYVLEAGAANPGVPPNLDRPDGTIWKIDVEPTAAALNSGIQFGVLPSGATQAVPEAGTTPQLETGGDYYLYVLRDIGAPIERCLFTYTGDGDITSGGATDASWGAVCADDMDCQMPTSYCVKMPGAAEGYCSIQCASNSVCSSNGAPADWTCNAVNCDVPQFTWCGPSAEIEESNGFLSVCE
ncbi:MAG: proteinase inhibitor [Bradymonadia bacterium]